MSKWIIIFSALCCFGMIGISQAQTGDDYTAQQQIEMGDKLFDTGKYKKAAEMYKKAWETAKIPRALYNLGRLNDNYLNDNRLALKYYEDYLAAEPLAQDEEKVRSLMDKARKDAEREEQWRKGTKPKGSALDSADMPPRTKLEGGPEKTEVVSSSNVCLTCHGKFLGPRVNMDATHPVDRIPTGVMEETVPKNVRFYKEGRVACLSCHNPTTLHYERGTPGFIYKYLRVDPGPNGEEKSRFCAFCHRTKSAAKDLSPQGSGTDQIIRRIK